MSYCLSMLLKSGLVFAADSRTNAGVDSVSTFRKLHIYQRPGERVIVLLSAGNLAIGQSVATMLEEGVDETGSNDTLYTVDSLYNAARMVGRALRKVYDMDAKHLKEQGAEFNASFIIGGQIAGRRVRLFQVYTAGNFIEATEDSPYFQIGEIKYGKPIIERVLHQDMDLLTAAKCALVSLDSTIRSNISVAPPIDLLIYRRDHLRVGTLQRIEEDDPYFKHLRKKWGDGVATLFDNLPDPDWKEDLES